jgi:hypothetical protein
MLLGMLCEVMSVKHDRLRKKHVHGHHETCKSSHDLHLPNIIVGKHSKLIERDEKKCKGRDTCPLKILPKG